MTQTNAFTRGKFLFEFLAVLFLEITLINQNFTGERKFTGTEILLRMILGGEHFQMIFRQIFNHHFQWIDDRHGTGSIFIQVGTQRVFQHGDIHHTVAAGHTDHVTEGTHRGRRKTTATHAGNGWHTRIIPA